MPSMDPPGQRLRVALRRYSNWNPFQNSGAPDRIVYSPVETSEEHDFSDSDEEYGRRKGKSSGSGSVIGVKINSIIHRRRVRLAFLVLAVIFLFALGHWSVAHHKNFDEPKPKSNADQKKDTNINEDTTGNSISDSSESLTNQSSKEQPDQQEDEKKPVGKEKEAIENENEKEDGGNGNNETIDTNIDETANRSKDVSGNKMSIKSKQIENYRKDNAIMINMSPTHHGLHTFCDEIGMHGDHGAITPQFVCSGDSEGIMPDPPECRTDKTRTQHSDEDPPYCYSYKEMHRLFPWSKNQTAPFIEAIQPYFHYFSATMNTVLPSALKDTDLENPNLVSVVITKDPLSRMLSGDGTSSVKYPGYSDGKLDRNGYWNFAVYDNYRNTDNFFLRIMTQEPWPKRTAEQAQIKNHASEGIERTTREIMGLFPTGLNRKNFQRGKQLLKRFTFVLDIACLDEGMDELGRVLGLNLPERSHSRKRDHPPTKERFVYDDVYEYLVAKNKWDIELYEYSKSISLVRCDELKD